MWEKDDAMERAGIAEAKDINQEIVRKNATEKETGKVEKEGRKGVVMGVVGRKGVVNVILI